jgi:anti-sigma regulatory factor (Ser/Thr protein kinase)
MSELVTNAVEHARTPLVLLVSFTGSTVLIEVSDGSLAEPHLQPVDASTLRGRGLQFVDALARSWSWRADGAGKTVWAEMGAKASRSRQAPHERRPGRTGEAAAPSTR